MSFIARKDERIGRSEQMIADDIALRGKEELG
jgi:hypothetical protein